MSVHASMVCPDTVPDNLHELPSLSVYAAPSEVLSQMDGWGQLYQDAMNGWTPPRRQQIRARSDAKHGAITFSTPSSVPDHPNTLRISRQAGTTDSSEILTVELQAIDSLQSHPVRQLCVFQLSDVGIGRVGRNSEQLYSRLDKYTPQEIAGADYQRMTLVDLNNLHSCYLDLRPAQVKIPRPRGIGNEILRFAGIHRAN